MQNLYAILIDLGVLGLFGLLYYFFQRRRIIKSSTLEVQDNIQELLYELHSFLEKNKDASFYAELDGFALRLEEAANTHDLSTMRATVEDHPESLPPRFKENLKAIKELF